jgi:hypothetical protein
MAIGRQPGEAARRVHDAIEPTEIALQPFGQLRIRAAWPTSISSG